MTDPRPTESAKLVALAYTTDVDDSVAGYPTLKGMGKFELPVKGSFTALVGRNGAGKTRLLNSIGAQTELVLSLPSSPTQTGALKDADTSPHRAAGLWGLAPVPEGYGLEDHSWLTPDTGGMDAGLYRGVRSIWPEHPRDRFLHFLNLTKDGELSNAVSVALQHENMASPHDSPRKSECLRLLRSEFTSDILEKISDLPNSLRNTVAYAATAMYPFRYRAGTDTFEDLFLIAIGLELATFSRVGITGAANNATQKLRFYFRDAPQLSPSCVNLLRAHRLANGAPMRSEDEEAPSASVAEYIEELESICYATADAGLATNVNSSWNFTPLLPLNLDGTAGVLHEGPNHTLWLEGVAAVPESHGLVTNANILPYGEGFDWGAGSWRFGTGKTDLSWMQEIEPDENGIIDLASPIIAKRRAADDEWRSKLIHNGSQPREISFVFSQDFLVFCERVVRAVNAVAAVIADDLPAAVMDPSDGTLRWRFIKHGPLPQSANDLLDLNNLSFGEQRWIRFSILIVSRLLDRVLTAYGTEDDRDWIEQGALQQLTAGVFEGCELVTVIDEPEAGLHPTAIDRLSKGLHDLAVHLGIHFVIATHSPIVLRTVQATSGTIAHSHIDLNGDRIFQAIDTAELVEIARDLGMNSVDLLHMTSTFLLVEGEHDRIVIDGLIGADIREAGVVITPLRGALKVSQIVDSDLVWRFTDARLVLVLDSIDSEQMASIVMDAKQMVSDGNMLGAIAALDPLKRDRSSKGKTEREAVYELLRSAVEANRIDRLEIFGLEEPDIIDYFHPRELGPVDLDSEYLHLPRREAWDLLHARYINTPKRDRKNHGFKSWAVETLGVGTDPSDVLRRASANLDRMPEDFERLRELLCSITPLKYG